MKTTKEKFKKFKQKTPEELEKDIEAIIKDIELIYMTPDEQIKEVGCTIGSEPFDSDFAIDESGESLEGALEEMRLGNPRRNRKMIYELIRREKSSELIFTIYQGFNAFVVDTYHKAERRQAKDAQNQKDVLERAVARCPLYDVTYRLRDPLIQLYLEGFAKFTYREVKHRYPNIQENALINRLYELLCPILKNKKERLAIIHSIFSSFYGLHKDINTIEATISKQNSPI